MMLEVFLPGAVGSKMMEVRGPMMVANRYEPHMKAALFLKDLRLILENGQNVGASLPLAGVAQRADDCQRLNGLRTGGCGVVLQVYETLAGNAR